MIYPLPGCYLHLVTYSHTFVRCSVQKNAQFGAEIMLNSNVIPELALPIEQQVVLSTNLWFGQASYRDHALLPYPAVTHPTKTNS